MTGHAECHETVDPATRQELLVEHGHRCQGCGRCGPEAGGLATLHVHHLTRDPDGMDEHDPENLTVLCRACHSWQHQQTTEDDVPVELTEEDLTVLLPQDVEILRILSESGPATTGDVAAALSADLTMTAVRERLWVVMGLDNLVSSRDRQVIDQDADTGEWGLAGQIEQSSRGRIPSDAQLLWQRVEDELVRQALDRGCDRSAVMSVLDLSRRSTFYKEKRGRAYDFPLDAMDRRGGRPRVETDGDERSDGATPSDGPDASDAQQQLDAVADGSGERVDAGQGLDGDAVEPDDGQDEQSAAGNGSDPEAHLEDAITALQALETVL
ncbi:HNH endonuclease [Halosimplex pelagicum]|uniref:HNH endonuclease n=1 Tax=Halosimplex pelagicum TaxID=869886 RepID=UPI001C54DF58|nr:HNH endonuclease [Halosimplex pelagicum]